MDIVEFPNVGLARRREDRSNEKVPLMPPETVNRTQCPAVAAYEKVCAATDIWAEHIPDAEGDRESAAKIEQAYDIFYRTTPTSLEGLRLQFESLVAVADIEGDNNLQPRILDLVRAIRKGFEVLEENRGSDDESGQGVTRLTPSFPC